MTLGQLRDTIESHEMAARVNVASTLRVAAEVMRAHPAVRELAKELKKQDVAEYILRRVFQLAEQASDLRFENPNDTALMIYTWLLNQCDYRLALMASAAISQVPNLWWASKVAADLLERRLEQNEMAGALARSGIPNVHAGDRLFAAATRFLSLGHARLLGPRVNVKAREHSGMFRTPMTGAQLLLFPSGRGGFTVSVRSGSTAEREYVAA